MKFATGFLAATLLILNVAEASSAVRIANDRGGQIGRYVKKYQRLASSGESVIIDGLCASACTIVLSDLPHDRICVTPRATLGLHADWNYGPDGRTLTDPEATLMLYSNYPTPVRRWIARKGGLKPNIIFLSGKSLHEMYRPCGSVIRLSRTRPAGAATPGNHSATQRKFTSPVRRRRWPCISNGIQQPARATCRRTPPMSPCPPISTPS